MPPLHCRSGGQAKSIQLPPEQSSRLPPTSQRTLPLVQLSGCGSSGSGVGSTQMPSSPLHRQPAGQWSSEEQPAATQLPSLVSRRVPAGQRAGVPAAGAAGSHWSAQPERAASHNAAATGAQRTVCPPLVRDMPPLRHGGATGTTARWPPAVGADQVRACRSPARSPRNHRREVRRRRRPGSSRGPPEPSEPRWPAPRQDGPRGRGPRACSSPCPARAR